MSTTPMRSTTSLGQQSTSLRLYNVNKHRRGNHIVFHKSALVEAAKHPVRLVPIRLDLEVDGLKIRDSFTWNLNETLISPEHFAQLLIEDIYENPPPSVQQLIAQIANSIRMQCQSWQNAVHDDEDALFSNNQNNIGKTLDETDGEKQENNYENDDDEELDWRTIIRLDLQVGQIHLLDQFEWPMLPSTAPAGTELSIAKSQPTPESFSQQLCADLGIGSEFASIIAHSIREQLCYARLNFDEAPKVQDIHEPPLRKSEEEDWQPSVDHLSEEEIERRAKEQERAARRLRRSQRISTNSTTIVMTRASSIDDGEDDDRRRSRSSMTRGAFSPGGGGNRFQPYGRMAGPYTSFSALPAHYQTGMYMNQFMSGGNRLGQLQPHKVPYRNYQPSPEEEQVIMKKLEETINLKNLAPAKSPPKKHRGFGASANRFNYDGSMDVGSFREKWRCSWCLLSGKFTPTLRKGPAGSKTLCNACGIWYGKHGSLPKDRYHEHGDVE